MTDNQPSGKETLLGVINQEVAVQRRWRSANRVLYITTASITIVASICAGIVGGFEHAKYSAIFAGMAAIFATTEKALRLQDRWRFHLKTLMRYESAKLELEVAGNVADVLKKVQQVMEDYPDGVPLSAQPLHQVVPEISSS